jgi:hypothetical protein
MGNFIHKYSYISRKYQLKKNCQGIDLVLKMVKPILDAETFGKIKVISPEETLSLMNLEKNDLYEMKYPVLEYPTKINSLSLDKTPNFKGKLTGINGQYLIFEDGTVFNIRSNEGYVVSIQV